MATRSNINVKVGDVYHSVYCHFDGNLEGVGKTLVLHYNSQKLAEKLVSNGDISYIEASCDAPEGHTYNTPVQGYTVYYGRDRGEEGTEFVKTDTPYFQEEYCYVWTGNEWRVSDGHSLRNELLSDVLGLEKTINPETDLPDVDDLLGNTSDAKVFKYFGCSIDEVIEINNEWAVTFNTPDPRMTDGYNERIRFMVRHREAPYQGMDEDGIWHHSFFGRTLYEAVSKGNEYLKRGQDFEKQYKDE